MERTAWGGVAIGVSLVIACSKAHPPAPAAVASAARAAPEKSAAPAALPAPASASVAAAAASAPANDPAIPPIPTERSKPPTKPEWDAGTKLNTAANADLDKSCSMKQVREWLRISCVWSVSPTPEWAQELGAKGSDWFDVPQAQTLIVRMRKGFDERAAFAGNPGVTLYLRANWPATADRPIEVSLGRKDTAKGDLGISKLPDFPTKRSKVPTVAEWRDAHEVNGSVPPYRGMNCRMLVVREWVKLHCSVELDLGDDALAGFGTKNSDYFGDTTEVVFRFKPGVEVQSGYFEAVWPKGADQPKTLKYGTEGT